MPDMPKESFETYISKTVGVPELIFEPLPFCLSKKGSYKITAVNISVGQYVSMSVSKHFSPKWLIGFFLHFA